MTLGVSEIFGPTIQGEGARAGQRTSFLRLGGCNLSCSWCDTPYTWDWRHFDPRREILNMDPTDVLVELATHRTSLLVVTGGEPMLQQRQLAAFLLAWGKAVQIETNGTIWPQLTNVDYSVSPKLASAVSGSAVKLDVLAQYVSLGATFKFVVTDVDCDMREILDICGEARIERSKVWLMPEARTKEELDERMGAVAAAAIAHGMNVSDRLHIRLWEGKRGH